MGANEADPSSDYEHVEQLLDEPWRIRCPYGHSALIVQEGPTVYCAGCGEAYHYTDLVDARESSVPVVSPPDKRHQ